MLLCASAGAARSISNVERSGAWYYLYDENGKKYKSTSASSTGDLKGFSSSIIVFQRGAWIYVYDADLKKLHSGAVSAYGEVIAVAGDAFTTRRGAWIYTYDKKGKKLNSRPAR